MFYILIVRIIIIIIWFLMRGLRLGDLNKTYLRPQFFHAHEYKVGTTSYGFSVYATPSLPHSYLCFKFKNSIFLPPSFFPSLPSSFPPCPLTPSLFHSLPSLFFLFLSISTYEIIQFSYRIVDILLLSYYIYN